MLDWYISVGSLLRDMRKKAQDAGKMLESGNETGAKTINGYLKADFVRLRQLWKGAGIEEDDFGNLGRHIGFGEEHDYHDILERDLPFVEANAERRARERSGTVPNVGFEHLLHPVIERSSMALYRSGHLRDAVLNSIVAVFDLMRARTGMRLDGVALVTECLSLEHPRLVMTELETESGRNDQKGFLEIIKGAYMGIRNPKAHSLDHDFDEAKAAQYLVFASLLARRVAEARVVEYTEPAARSKRDRNSRSS